MKNMITLSAIFLLTANAFAQQSPWIYYRGQGQDQLYKKDYTEAKKSFISCIKENEKADDCYVGLGKAHLGDGNPSAARSSFNLALKINPKNKEALAGLAANPSDDAPLLTTEGLKTNKKLSDEDKKILNNVIKSQDDLYQSLPKTNPKKTDTEQQKKDKNKKINDSIAAKYKDLIYV